MAELHPSEVTEGFDDFALEVDCGHGQEHEQDSSLVNCIIMCICMGASYQYQQASKQADGYAILMLTFYVDC